MWFIAALVAWALLDSVSPTLGRLAAVAAVAFMAYGCIDGYKSLRSR